MPGAGGRLLRVAEERDGQETHARGHADRRAIRLGGPVVGVERPRGNRVPSCAIITTAANELLRPIHDRMPVVLPKELEEFWLDASVEDAPTLTGIMASYPASAMEAFEVSRLVNSVANDAPEVVAPVGEAR